MYQFLLNMWIMRRIGKDFLGKMVTKGRITQEQEEMILTTPRVGDVIKND